MTHHDAMVSVLRDARRECTGREIAAAINQGDLWLRRNGSPCTPSGVNRRAGAYHWLFYRNPATGTWGLREWALRPVLDRLRRRDG